jgi:shikimate dehydrogenase
MTFSMSPALSMSVPSGRTRLLAVVADPVHHLRALPVYNGIFKERGIDAVAAALQVPAEALGKVVPALALCPNVAGLIVTTPHKQSVSALCDSLTEDARMVGAANTIRLSEGRAYGALFDGRGLLVALQDAGIAVRQRQVLLAGTGGAGRAIAFALAGSGVSALELRNRSVDRAETLARDLRRAYPSLKVGINTGVTADVIINASSLGMREGDPLPVPETRLKPGVTVIDIVIARPTELLTTARAAGCRTLDGRAMLTAQLDVQLDFLNLSPTSALHARS